jgi:hypothetical protein
MEALYKLQRQQRVLTALVVTGLALAFAPAAMATNLLTNPTFDDTDNNGDYGDGWGSFGAAGFHNFFGSAHASFFSDSPGNSGGVFQLGIPGIGGTEYQFDLVDVRIEDNADANYRFGIEYYLADDSTKIGESIVAMPLSPTGDGLSFSMSATAPPTTGIIRPIILFDNTVGAASSQENVFVFETSLTAVPEPATALLMGLGIFAIARRRQTR